MSLRRATVLVVDDEPLLLSLLVTALRQVDCDVLQSTTADAALRLSSDVAQPLDLVVSDFQMPDMSGISLAAEMRRQRPDLQFVFITGNQEVSENLSAQGYPCLTKPFPLDEFRSVIRERLRSPQ
jgi:two-component system cell cycle sensor histidine kinase/response regulator CckA